MCNKHDKNIEHVLCKVLNEKDIVLNNLKIKYNKVIELYTTNIKQLLNNYVK